MKGNSPKPVNDAARDERARDWELTAFVAWAGAIAAVIWSRLVNGPHTGDVAFAGYLALVGLGLWFQAVRIRHATTAPSFSPALANVLVIALTIGFVLGIADLASGGRF